MAVTAIEESKIRDITRRSIPLTIKTFTFPRETELYLEEILGLFLRELGQEQLKDTLAYCMKELAVNAKKANTKRVYFQEKKLDISSSADYEKGMKTFKQETISDINAYLQKQKDAGYFIKIIFHVKERTLHLSVCNNAEITVKEQMRLHDRIARAKACATIQDALTYIMDETEGAGLGIAMLVILLRKIGLDENAFEINSGSGNTEAKIVIPMEKIRIQNLDMLSEEIVREIEALPQFPENIVHIQQLINSPDTGMQEIAREISTDPAITADLIKTVNSAQYMLQKPVNSVTEAVKLVGLKGIKNLLYSYGTQKLLQPLNREMKGLWEHSFRTGFYACELARQRKAEKNIIDEIYVGGILHDMGKIVFSVVHPRLLDRINGFCREKMIPSRLFEDLTAGLNHAEIGARIAEKWNFPPALVCAIRYHHDPHGAPQAVRPTVYPVYLANAILMYEQGYLFYEQLHDDILREFGIKSEAELQKLREKLDREFKKEPARY